MGLPFPPLFGRRPAGGSQADDRPVLDVTTGTLPKIADDNGTILAGNQSIRGARESGEAPLKGFIRHPAPQRKPLRRRYSNQQATISCKP
jgi:hypothetical protein